MNQDDEGCLPLFLAAVGMVCLCLSVGELFGAGYGWLSASGCAFGLLVLKFVNDVVKETRQRARWGIERLGVRRRRMRFKLPTKCQEGDEIPWHKWFAWYPISVENEVLWLETVHRKGTVTFDTYSGFPTVRWEYRFLENFCR
jgi:hypothetical protein